MNGLRTRSRKKSKVSGNKWTHNSPKLWGHSKGRPDTVDPSNTGLPKKGINISNKQPNPTSTRTGGTITNKAQREYKEGNNQDQSRINWHRA